MWEVALMESIILVTTSLMLFLVEITPVQCLIDNFLILIIGLLVLPSMESTQTEFRCEVVPYM